MKSKKTWIVVASVVVALLLVVGGIFGYSAYNKNQEAKRTEIEQAAKDAVDNLYMPHEGAWDADTAQLASDITTQTIEVATDKTAKVEDNSLKSYLTARIDTAEKMYMVQVEMPL